MQGVHTSGEIAVPARAPSWNPPAGLPPEFELILECARFPLSPEGAGRIRALAERPLEWNLLLEMAHHHQVIPLLARHLHAAAASIPPAIRIALRQEAANNTRRCFECIAELVLLVRLFGERGLDLRVLKGPPLAIAAFGDPGLRQVGDIDLLIAASDLEIADRILRDEGYTRSDAAAWKTPRRRQSYLAHQKDFEYDPPAGRHPIDLHWRLYRNRWIPANARIAELGLDWVELSSARIPILPPDETFLYLCVHGALDGWLRLKWLADVGALHRSLSQVDLRSMVARAKERGALPEVSAALLLCRKWLGAGPPPAGCLDAGDAAVAQIIRFSGSLLTSNHCRPDRNQISATRWFAHEFRLYPRVRARAELLERSLFRPRLWARFSLPDTFFPLYVIIRPFEWIGSRLVEKVERCLPRRTVFPRPADLRLLIEAICMLGFFRAALRLVPVERLVTWMGTAPAGPPESGETAKKVVNRVAWAIGAVVRHTPFRFVCFPQSLAAYFMLRRRGIASKLFYGVAREGNRLKAHTWVKAGGRTVTGGDAEPDFTVLTTFPAQGNSARLGHE